MPALGHAPTPFGRRVGRYELLLPIARGGMATVYLARKLGAGGFEKEVALKLTHEHLRDRPEWATELIEEAKLAARIRHPNVVSVLDVDDDPNGVFLVMEYIEGDSLSGLSANARGRGEPIPTPILLRILRDALSGLHEAHELCDARGAHVGLVHRDFSPQNILVGIDGVTRLTDFGVAKASSRAGFTESGVLKGKIGYMSPEQVRGRTLDRRSDVWAAGVVAWELFTGQRLFASSEGETATMLRILGDAPPRVRSVRPELPLAVDDAIASALMPNVNARCATAEELNTRIADGAQTKMADPTEVASYVRTAAEPRLTSRRAMIHEALSSSVLHTDDIDQPAVATESAVSTRAVPSPPSAPQRPPRRFFLVASVIAVASVLSVSWAFLRGPARPAESTPLLSVHAAATHELPFAPAPEPPPQASTAAVASQSRPPSAQRPPPRRGVPRPSRGAEPPASVATPIPEAPATVAPAPKKPRLHASPYE